MGGSKGGKRKRFSDEQIQSLEVMFGSELKPEPRTKQQLASDLGLHPRQVAIWFQNRRARLKSKQIEREYSVLNASYDSLAAKFECLMIENQALAAQVQNLRDRLGRDEGCTVGEETDKSDDLHGSNDKPTYIPESYDSEMDNKALIDACTSNADWLERKDDILNLAEPVDSSLTSSENSWNSRPFLDHKCSSPLLWEFWS